MKKIIAIIVIAVLGLSNMLVADNYRMASDNVKTELRALESAAPESLSITSAQKIVSDYKDLGIIATNLGNTESYIWTVNNAMYANIVLFKKLVRYEESNKAINALSPKNTERTRLLKDLQFQYIKYAGLLNEVDVNGIIRDTQSNATKKQWARIVSNRDFIIGVNAFVNHKF